MSLYTVDTPAFGQIKIVADNIRDARTRARKVWGVKNPRLVRAVTEAVHCERCDCRPCVCHGEAPAKEGGDRG